MTEILGIDAVIPPEWEKSGAPERGHREVTQERVRELGQRSQVARSFAPRLPWSETKVDTDETHMKTYRVIYVDAFASVPFCGNPCAILPEASGLTDEDARQY